MCSGDGAHDYCVEVSDADALRKWMVFLLEWCHFEEASGFDYLNSHARARSEATVEPLMRASTIQSDLRVNELQSHVYMYMVCIWHFQCTMMDCNQSMSTQASRSSNAVEFDKQGCAAFGNCFTCGNSFLTFRVIDFVHKTNTWRTLRQSL